LGVKPTGPEDEALALPPQERRNSMPVSAQMKQCSTWNRSHSNRFFWAVRRLLMEGASNALEDHLTALKTLTETQGQSHIAVVHMEAKIAIGSRSVLR
jgi:hypothetical protein